MSLPKWKPNTMSRERIDRCEVGFVVLYILLHVGLLILGLALGLMVCGALVKFTLWLLS
ncbi:MAG TPA: hypothetical protein VM537_29275 [Anaerolineae bacterium]|nr:hypothetical protein [Anaerolineae bacterium]